MLPQPRTLKLISIGICAALITSAQAGFYRWVDDDGTIHYSDSLPPQESQRKQDILNEHGRTVKSISAPKTLGELEEEERLAKIEEQKIKTKTKI